MASPDETLKRAREARIKAARKSPAAFIEYVLRNERDNTPFVLMDFHKEWLSVLEKHKRVVLHGFIGSGKSSVITVGKLLWELGNNPNLRILLVSNVEQKQAGKWIGLIGHLIKNSVELREVFPHLRPARNGEWSTHALFVERSSMAKDPSVQACGFRGNILGGRFDLILADDFLDWDLVQTQEMRQTVDQWFELTVLSRLERPHGRAYVLGTAWDKDDLLFRLSRRSGWKYVRTTVEDENGEPRWPARWPKEAIAEARLHPHSASRTLDCIPRSDDEAVFSAANIEACFKRGEGLMVTRFFRPSPPVRVGLGLDLAFTQGSNSDLTALCAVACSGEGQFPRRQLLCVEAGKWSFDEVLARIVEWHKRYPGRLAVETVGGMKSIADLLKGPQYRIPVDEFKTSARMATSLRARAEMLNAEMAQQRWAFPSGFDGRTIEPEVSKLAREAYDYTPHDHAGDRLVSLLLAHYALGGSGYVEFFDKSKSAFTLNR